MGYFILVNMVHWQNFTGNFIQSKRYKAPDTLDMSPVLDRPISPTSERRTSQNGLSSASAKKRVNSKLYLKYK
jgi:hypothetical protein